VKEAWTKTKPPIRSDILRKVNVQRNSFTFILASIITFMSGDVCFILICFFAYIHQISSKSNVLLPRYIDIRNSAVAEKLRDLFVQTQSCGWPKYTSLPYVLPCQIWSFCVKGCTHGTLLSWDGRWGWPHKNKPLPIYVTMSNLVLLRQGMYA